MAGKISTLILTVDLGCYICTKKIKKTILKLQAREQIQTVTFDEKSNTVTISGPFDPQKLKKKLLCKASKVIKEIKIKEEEKKKPPPPPKEAKPAEPEKPKPEKEKAKPPEPEKEKPKPPPKEPEKAKPTEPEKEKPKPVPVQECQPVGPPLPSCCWRPCYEQYYGSCRCCSCGMFFGWSAPPPPPPAGCWMGGPPASTCQFFCEEDPSCTIM